MFIIFATHPEAKGFKRIAELPNTKADEFTAEGRERRLLRRIVMGCLIPNIATGV